MDIYKNGYLPKLICFKNGYFYGKLDIFQNWAWKFLLISHNMTRVWSF